MIDKTLYNKYRPTIGIECHVQLKTKSKLFSSASNDARLAAPNTLVNHIDFGLPGALPVLNRDVITLSTRMALALNTKPESFSVFERKHYFYPDLPMGYQISQLHQPIIVGGKVNVEVNGKQLQIRINRVQIEADAGKNTHPSGQDYSLVDLNRAGTPLLEIVSEPDLHSPSEAKAYVHELYLLVRYADVSDADLYHGNMRFDVNVSVSQVGELGTRTETKNLNSFRAVEKAAEYEIKRQIEVLEKGGEIAQETRGWDESKQKTTSQRSKEEAHDYRYMPDPDLPPITIDDKYIKEVEKSVAAMPAEWRKRLNSLGLDKAQIETLLDANTELSGEKYLSQLEQFLNDALFAKQLANWFVNVDIPWVRANEGYESKADRQAIYKQVFDLVKSNKLSSTKAKELIEDLLDSKQTPSDIASYAESKGYIQVSDEDQIVKIVDKVLKEHVKAADDLRKGEEKAISFLIGQVMKESRGKANPQLAQKLIKEQLNIAF